MQCERGSQAVTFWLQLRLSGFPRNIVCLDHAERVCQTEGIPPTTISLNHSCEV